MNFISFAKKKMGLTNQWFALSNGISEAIENKCKVVVIDKFLCDYNQDKYKNISNHPWFGFTNSQINPYERNNLVKEFKGTNEIIKKLQNKIDDIKKNIPNADETKNLDSVDGAQKLISLGKIEDLEKTLKYLKYIKNEDDINIVDNLIRIISNNKENLNFEKSLQKKIKLKNLSLN